jgi:phage terminase large subunit GpA-like protein
MKSHETAVANLRKLLRDTLSAVLKPPPRLTVPDWADAYRHLSSASGAFGGPWNTSRVEVARGPMMAVTEPGVRRISAMTCTQLLKTSLLENVIGYFAHLDPCPILLLQPKDESAQAFSKERIAPMIEVTPVLRELMGRRKTRTSEDTVKFKRFPGGFLAIASAGSPSNLAMRAIRIVLSDEIDKYETTKEGDPVILAEERTATFTTSSLSIRTCSPTWEETSRIYAAFMAGDQRRPFVRCPHCDEFVYLDFFRDVHWSKNTETGHEPQTAAIYCPECGAGWSEAQRMHAVTKPYNIRHQQTRPFLCCGERQDPISTKAWTWDEERQVGYAVCRHCGGRSVSNSHASFTASKLYSPFITMADLAEKWLSSKGDPEARQTFYNTQLGQPYKAQVSRNLNQHALMSRCEAYPAPVPIGGLVLTAGIDVQSTGRLEVEVVAWGLGEESWSIAHEVITGDLGTLQPWEELDAFLLKPWLHERGFQIYIMGACLDSGGHNTQTVYDFAQKRSGRNIWAIKGASDRGTTWSPIWPAIEKPGKYRLSGFKPVIIGVSAAKESIRQRLALEEVGPGYCHFPVGRHEAWFDQLTAENIVVERHGAQYSRRWVLPRGRANEALDCRAYSYAALFGLYRTRKLDLDKQAELMESYVEQNRPVVAGRRIRKSTWMKD